MEQVNTTLVAVVIYLPQDPTLPHAWGYVGVGGGGSLDSLGPHAGRPHGAHIRQERTEARIHATPHRFAVYYYDNTTQLLHTHIAYYHYYTPKFPSHTVGVPCVHRQVAFIDLNFSRVCTGCKDGILLAAIPLRQRCA